jgi:hypothetical protein
MSDNDMKDILYKRRIKAIRRGIYTFNELTSKDYRERAEKELLEDYRNNTITPQALKALVQFECDRIKIGEIEIEGTPEEIRDLVKEKFGDI